MMFTGIDQSSGSDAELLLLSKVIEDLSGAVGESPVRELEGIDRAPALVYKFAPVLSDPKTGSAQYILGLNVENEFAIYSLECGKSNPVKKTAVIARDISDF